MSSPLRMADGLIVAGVCRLSCSGLVLYSTGKKPAGGVGSVCWQIAPVSGLVNQNVFIVLLLLQIKKTCLKKTF